MEKTTEKQRQSITIRQRFDDILMEHMRRLLGMGSGTGGLTLNLLNVSCVVLLAEQQANEEKQLSTPEDRYTRDLLFQELAETGLDSETEFDAALQQMQQKAYVHIDESGRISGKEPALQMARHINSILPQMPGLNLIAYIAQTIDEAVSGRKDVDDAVDQFDQTLTLQGVSARKSDQKPAAQAPAQSHVSGSFPAKTTLNRKGKNPKGTKSKNLLSAADYDRLQKVVESHAASPTASAAPRIISSNRGHEAIAIQVVSFGAPPPTEEKIAGEPLVKEDLAQDRPLEKADADDVYPATSYPEKETEEEIHPVQEADVTEEMPEIQAVAEAGTSAQTDAAPGESIDQGGPKKQEAPEQILDVSVSGAEAQVAKQPTENAAGNAPSGVEEKNNGDPVNDEVPRGTQEDVIESRISSFEKNLAMQCPACKAGAIIAEKTTKNKTYYKCLNKACNFISWGKPYHQVCPNCQNPWLIEDQRNGQTVLKCPRSTCSYWQADTSEPARKASTNQATNEKAGKPKPRRRVVKRRVVRRKKA